MSKTPYSRIPTLWTRRRLLQSGVGAVALGVVPALPVEKFSRRLSKREWDLQRSRDAHLATLVEPGIMQKLALAAVDAAKDAGALYASASLTRIVKQQYTDGAYNRAVGKRGSFESALNYWNDKGVELPVDSEELGLGVRVLMPGGWGFAATAYWEIDEAIRAARDAVVQARANGKTLGREIDLGQYPAAKGHWTTPIRIDPFAIPMEEKIDFLMACAATIRMRFNEGRGTDDGIAAGKDDGIVARFWRKEQTVATSEGALFSQICYRSYGNLQVQGTINTSELDFRQAPDREKFLLYARGLEYCGAGWEMFLDANLVDQLSGEVQRKFEDFRQRKTTLKSSSRSVDVGRYDIVCDAGVMAHFVNATVGSATQLDRAMGWEANATGTSYLGPNPLELLGKFSYQSPQFTVTANRSQSKALATVKWDDDGVEAEDAVLIKNGIFTDYQTTRESAAWLAPYYQKIGQPVRSHGYASSESALFFPLTMTPNLVLSPAVEEVTTEQLIKGVKKGLYITNGEIDLDFQARTGVLGGNSMIVQEIIDGEIHGYITDAGILFDTTTLWKDLLALGGKSAAASFNMNEHKGEPKQKHEYTVTAVPGAFKQMAVINFRSRG